MPCQHQDPDDLTCRPIMFRRYDTDQTVEDTYGIQNDWHLPETKKLGELVVRRTPDGFRIKILMEP